MIKKIGVVRIRASGLVFKDKKLIIVEHKKKGFNPYYVLPGGGIEHGESPEQALVREIKEEINLDVKIKNLVFYKTVYNDEDYSLDLVFRCEVVGGIVKNSDPDKKVINIKYISSIDNSVNLYSRQQ